MIILLDFFLFFHAPDQKQEPSTVLEHREGQDLKMPLHGIVVLGLYRNIRMTSDAVILHFEHYDVKYSLTYAARLRRE